MSRFLDTLKYIIHAEPITVVIEPTPTNLLQHVLTNMQSFYKSHLPYISNHISEFVSDKSQSELLFLLAIVLAVLLFVVILPVYETLFGGHDNELLRKTEECYEAGMRMYKPGVGIVTMDAEDIAEMVRASSGGSASFSSCGGSSRSVCSYGSCGMETIEESEEEDEEDDVIGDDCDESDLTMDEYDSFSE